MKEAICLENGIRSSLGHCYWYWGRLARAQADKKTEKEKLEQALAIFTELKRPCGNPALVIVRVSQGVRHEQAWRLRAGGLREIDYLAHDSQLRNGKWTQLNLEANRSF